MIKYLNVLLDHMNRAYTILRGNKEVTNENFEAKLKEISDYDFNDKQKELLKRDLFNEDNK